MTTGLSQKEIADKLGLEGPTIIPIIDKLEKDGFVKRMVDKNDRRNNRIFLTEKTIDSIDSDDKIRIKNKRNIYKKYIRTRYLNNKTYIRKNVAKYPK